MIHCTACGSIAFQKIFQVSLGEVKGITTKGIFVELGPGDIVFLTGEKFRGPLTVNFSEFSPFQIVANQDKLQIKKNQIFFTPSRLTAAIPHRSIWAPEQKPVDRLVLDGSPERIRAGARFIVQGANNTSDMTPFLSYLLNKPDAFLSSPSTLVLKIARIQGCLKNLDIPGVLFALEELLGRGRGLTPSGDDFICGVLLVLQRLKLISMIDKDIAESLSTFLHQSRIRTPSISASLIECAALGLADERLIQALDSILGGDPPVESVMGSLASWGASSGLDVFTGMAAALTSLDLGLVSRLA